MVRSWNRCAAALMCLFLLESVTWGQFGGSRAGGQHAAEATAEMATLSREVVEGFIAIEGSAEIRVRPTEIRIVLAVVAEGPTAQECHALIDDSIRNLRKAWTEQGIPAENIVDDFIAVLPRYEWNIEKHGGVDVGVENKVGYRMQTNMHLAVPNDGHAAKAFTTAFEHGVTDIIAFDYWSRELDAIKLKAREQAVKAARDKSELLLAALFESPPPVINVQEQTTIRFPDSLYHSFVNAQDEAVTPGLRRDLSFIRASRPRNTYYRGLQFNGDVQSSQLSMSPEISVISTVRLYFKSGAAGETKDGKNPEGP